MLKRICTFCLALLIALIGANAVFAAARAPVFYKDDYTVYVVAENAYGNQSEPIKTDVTVEGESGVKGIFTRLRAR